MQIQGAVVDLTIKYRSAVVFDFDLSVIIIHLPIENQ